MQINLCGHMGSLLFKTMRNRNVANWVLIEKLINKLNIKFPLSCLCE